MKYVTGCVSSYVGISCLLLLFVTTACRRSGIQTVPIEGTVTYNDQPLSSGTVLYVPRDRVKGRQARGTIASDGSFRLSTLKPGDGACYGQYDIAIVALKAHPGEDRAAIEAAGGIVQRGSLIPDRYSDPTQSGLSDVVDENHSGSKRIELHD